MAWGASGQEMGGRQRQEARKGEGVLYLLYAACVRAVAVERVFRFHDS